LHSEAATHIITIAAVTARPPLRDEILVAGGSVRNAATGCFSAMTTVVARAGGYWGRW